MKGNLKLFVITGLLMLFIFGMVLVVCANDTVKIGCLFPVTGPIARGGIDCREGVQLATKIQNEKGGLWGKQIELVYGDAVDPKIAVTETERLINKEGVNIIIGTYASSRSFAASNIAEKYKKIYWETSANSDEITDRGFKYVFRTNAMAGDYLGTAGDIMEGTVCPKLEKSPEELKVALVVEDTVYGVTAFERSKIMFKERGFTNVVLEEIFDPNAIDLSSLIMKLKSKKPDLLVMAAHLPQEVLFWNQAKDLNWDVGAYLCPTGEGATTAEYQESLGKGVNGHIIISYCPPPQAVNPEYAIGINEFGTRYEEEYGHKVISVYPLICYAGTEALFKVLEKAGSDDPEAIRKAAYEIEIPTLSAGFEVKFDPETGQNMKATCVALQWQGGNMYTTWPAEAALEKHELVLPLPTWKERAEGKDI